MAKREAENQGRRGAGIEEPGWGIPKDNMSSRATAAQLANRKIKEARKRPSQVLSANRSSGSSQPAQNPFAGINITPTPATGGQQQTPSSNGFNFNASGGTLFGAQSSSFPPNQPSSSTSSFNFSAPASSSFPNFGASATNPFANQTPQSSSFSGFQGSIFNIPGQPASQKDPTDSNTPKDKNDKSDLSMEDASPQNSSTPPRVFNFGGQGTTLTFGAGASKPDSGPGQESRDGQTTGGILGSTNNSTGIGKPETPAGDQMKQNLFGQPSSTPAPNGIPAFSQSKENESKSQPGTAGSSTPQPPSFSELGKSGTDSAKPVPDMFGATPKPTTSQFGGPQSQNKDTTPLQDKAPQKDQSNTYPESRKAPQNVFGSITQQSSTPPVFTFGKPTDTSVNASPLKPDQAPSDPAAAPSKTPEASTGQSNTSKLFGQKLFNGNGAASSSSLFGMHTSKPAETPTSANTMGNSVSKPSESSAPKLFSFPPSNQTPTPKFSIGATPDQPQNNTPQAASQPPAPKINNLFGGPKFDKPQQFLNEFNTPSPINAGLLGSQLQKTAETDSSPAPSTTPAAQSQPTSSTGMPQVPTDASQSRTNSDATNINNVARDAGSNQPAQKITFSSRGPSHIPSYLDNDTRAEVDIGHRLRSLNEGLQKHLSKLNPASVDFGRAIEYYCDARQALGKPLKFHQRASAGEKRKETEREPNENSEPATKRQKGLDEAATPTTQPPAINMPPATTDSSVTSATPSSQPAGSSASGQVNEKTSGTSSILKNLMSTPEKPPSAGTGTSQKSSIFSQPTSAAPPSSFGSSTIFGSPAAFSGSNSSAPLPPPPSFNLSSASPAKPNQADTSRNVADNSASVKNSRKRTSNELDSDNEHVNENAQGPEDGERSKRHKSDSDATKVISNGADESPPEEDTGSQTSNSISQGSGGEDVSGDNVSSEQSDYENEEADDENRDPSYDPKGEPEDEADDSESSEPQAGAKQGNSDSGPKYESGKGPSLFDRISRPDGSSPVPVSEDPKESSTFGKNTDSTPRNIFGSNAFGSTTFGGFNSTGQTSPNSSKPMFGTASNGQSKPFSASSPAPGKENHSTDVAEKTPKPSVFKTTPPSGSSGTPSATSNNLTNGNVFGSSAFKPSTEAYTSFGTPSAFGTNKEIPSSGLFGSRPATPTLGSGNNSNALGKDTSANNTSPAVDHTFKRDSPIKFASVNSAPAVTFTAASPSQTEKKDASSASTPKPLSALFGDSTGQSTPANQNQKPSSLGFSFGSHLKPAGSFGTASSDVSSINSANTSRATSPGVTDTDEGDDAAEDGKDEQTSLMAARPGEENEDVLFDLPTAKAFKMEEGKSWKSVALGSFRVLKHKTTKKTRILLRADPGANIILNTFLSPFVQYTAIAPGANSKQGAVQFLIPVASGNPEQWLLKMKGTETAQKLASVLEANKK
ncbi:MAG: hypothetical protein Q9227_000523 [Pyrenula ochraceoflavens]